MKPAKTRSRWILIFLLTVLFSAVREATAATEQTWENRFVALKFDFAKGTFSVIDRRNQSRWLEDATFQVNDLISDQGFVFTVHEEPTTDAVGEGRTMSFEGKKSGQPTLILQVTLYRDATFVALNVGIETTREIGLRIMTYSPARGSAYRGLTFDDFRTLDGENGAFLSKVSAAGALSSNNNLLVTFGKKGEPKHSLVIGGLTYHEFQKRVSVKRATDRLEIEMQGSDPVGKRVDAGTRYLLRDKFYLDGGTDNRFEALEKYGAALRAANHVEIGGVNFPILNFWYAHVSKFGADEFRNNSVGTVVEMEEIVKSGFLKYSPVGLRLEPDDYALPSNAQGWWDDAHWQKYKSGQLLAPYNTIVSWGEKIREMGGIPFIYCQTAKRSEDYCLEHPEQMLFNDPLKVRSKGPIGWWGREGDKTAVYWTYDFTDPGFVAHMRSVYANLKAGGVRGIKFDYPDTGWAYDGGFEDKYATTTSAYRQIFKLAYEGLGANRDVQERIPPFGDIALGVVTTQRTEGDNDRVYPGRIAKTGLRWYKNRMVVNYDHDPINPNHIYPQDSRDGWRAAVTMTATTAGRMEIGKYFERMSEDVLHDLSRAVPLLSAPTLSARPIDAFSGKLYPQVYDFTVKPDWHVVTFFNSALESEEWPTDVMAYWTEGKQFNPRKMIPGAIEVAMGEPTDDGGLGLETQKSYHVFDFWNWQYLGVIAGNGKLRQTLRPGEARVMAVHEVSAAPQFLSTNRHLLQGVLDLSRDPEWSARRGELAGTSRVVADDPYKVVVSGNGYRLKNATASSGTCEVTRMDEQASIYEITLRSPANAEVTWTLAFDRTVAPKR